MWQLTRNSVNNLAATLQDTDVGGKGDKYMVGFYSLDQDPIFCLPVIISDTERITTFTIELNTTQDPQSGIIDLRVGHYDVRVYRRRGNDFELDPDSPLVDGIVFEGEAFVESDVVGDTFYSYTLTDSIYYER